MKCREKLTNRWRASAENLVSGAFEPEDYKGWRALKSYFYRSFIASFDVALLSAKR